MISLHTTTPAPDQPADSSETPNNAIFGKTLDAKVRDEKKSLYIESKNKKKAYASFAISLVLLVVYSFSFFFENSIAYFKAPAEITVLESRITEFNEVVLPSLEASRDLHKSAYDQEFEEVISALETVFPVGQKKREIVQLFETFAAELSVNFPPFEFTSISLRTPQAFEGHQITTVSTSIHSSLAGFDRFLALVDRSGEVYESDSSGEQVLLDRMIRLMSISNVSVNYRGINEETGRDDGVDFNVTIDIYSRIPAQTF